MGHIGGDHPDGRPFHPCLVPSAIRCPPPDQAFHRLQQSGNLRLCAGVFIPFVRRVAVVIDADPSSGKKAAAIAVGSRRQNMGSGRGLIRASGVGSVGHSMCKCPRGPALAFYLQYRMKRQANRLEPLLNRLKASLKRTGPTRVAPAGRRGGNRNVRAEIPASWDRDEISHHGCSSFSMAPAASRRCSNIGTGRRGGERMTQARLQRRDQSQGCVPTLRFPNK